MKPFLIAGLLAVGTMSVDKVQAQQKFDAVWIWAAAGNPAVSAPAGKVWFRRDVYSDSPSTGEVRIVCDDHFVLWVNGRRIGEGGGLKLSRFILNGIVGRGHNIIAVEATNKAGKAGLFIDGSIRTQGGRSIPFDGGPLWRATTTAPQGIAWQKPDFDMSKWKPVKVIGPHKSSPWKSLALKETALDRFLPAAGFQVKQIAGPKLVGSLISMTWGNDGRLIASRERGPVLSVSDSNHDGVYDRVVEYTRAVTNCQGLCMVGDDLYAVGNGPQGVGLYRLPDRNHDGVADKVIHLYKYRGSMGDHGPHDVVFGPDGRLYNNMGNHAGVEAQRESTSPLRNPYEGDLLRPKFEDARGHARGIKAPGGTIWRFSRDGKKWWCETAGFRNEYDFAFNARGDLFSFDSDMEWDVGMPWYRPIRITHCIPGAEFGWRSGAAKWPAYYFDSLPGTVDIGRGSPTGVVFYNHRQFPKQYRGTFIACDWSMGRILAVTLSPRGATYAGRYTTLLSGNPLNVADVEVDRDGSIVFCTGGRNTEGGIYRISYTKGTSAPAPSRSVADAVNMPQIQAAWARDLADKIKHAAGDRWQTELVRFAKTGSPQQKIQALTLLSQLGPQPKTELLIELSSDKDSRVRSFVTLLLGGRTEPAVRTALVRLLGDRSAFVQRRACEAFVRSGIEAPVPALLELLGSSDRWLRFAARLTLQRVPVAKWRGQVLASSNPEILVHGLLALHRVGADRKNPGQALALEAKLLANNRLTSQQTVEVLRMIELTLLAGGRGPAAQTIGRLLLQKFPTNNEAIDAESARIMAVLQVPGAAAKIVRVLEAAPTRAKQIHYVLALRYLNAGWNPDLNNRLLGWYDSTRNWDGGNSFKPYLANILGASLGHVSSGERRDLAKNWRERPFAAALILRNSKPDQIEGFGQLMSSILNDDSGSAIVGRDQLVGAAIEALGKSRSLQTRKTLRTLYDSSPDFREPLARVMAARPTVADLPYLVRTLSFADTTTLQLSLAGLRRLPTKPKTAEAYRAVILAGLKLGDRRGRIAVAVLRKWTGIPHSPKNGALAAIRIYRNWYIKTYPNAPSATLPKRDRSKTKYTLRQLLEFLERTPQGRSGNARRGRKIFVKAKCSKCHRFGKEGEIVGPDLTSVRRRFQRKEIIESLVFPSQVISDQYRMIQIVTEDGLIHNGMPLPESKGGKNIVLLLSDATKISVPKSKIEEQKRSKVSVMPVGSLKELSLQDIADLFAFLETSRTNPLTPRDARAAAGGK